LVAKLSTERDRERFIDFLRVQALPIDAQARPWKEPRKLTANAYLWTIYQQLVEHCGFTSDDWHLHYTGEYFGWVEHVTPSGNVEYRPKRSTTKDEAGRRDVLKGEPFNKFLMFVEEDCAKRGLFIERGAI
jgi:hypothetical protein